MSPKSDFRRLKRDLCVETVTNDRVTVEFTGRQLLNFSRPDTEPSLAATNVRPVPATPVGPGAL